MNLLNIIGVIFCAVNVYGRANPVFLAEETTAFKYFERIGIPEAERLKNEEEAFLRGNTNRIVGGGPANNNQFPYQAGLIIDFAEISGNGICGASLLSSTRLVTAAHCWFDGTNQASQYTVVLGSILLFSGGTRVQTKDVVTHPEWNPARIMNDVAVIKLSDPVSLSASISPIKLPSGSQLQEDYAGSEAVVSGFGKTTDSSGITIGQFLSNVTVDVSSNFICTLFFPGVFQNSNICTSGLGGKGPCNGDSGGPLVVKENDSSVLIGIVSFGSSLGCSIGFPAVFTRVTSFIDFIQGHL